MNRGKSSQNRYCCVPLCDQKGSTGPNGERVGFFSIPTEKHLREQWLHAIRREPGKHFSVTDSTKVCSLHFKDEHLKKSFGIGRLTYIEGAVPSVFAWKRSSPRKRPPPKPRANYPTAKKKARASLDLSAVPDPLSEISQDININLVPSSETWQDMSAAPGTPSETVGSEMIASESVLEQILEVSENQLFYEDLQRQLAEMQQLLKESEAKNAELEAEVKKVRSHAFTLSEKCENLENRIFKLDNFLCDEDMAFYTGFPSYGVFMATYNYLNPGERGENIRYWLSVSKDVGPEYYEKDPQLGVGPGKPRTLNSKVEFFLVMCRLRQGFAERHLGHLFNISQSTVSRIVISWVNFMYLRFGLLNIWPSRKVVDDTMPQDFKNKYPNTRAIIDCTEIKCQMPSSLLLNSELFSSYKNNTTLKGLIAISPAGHISFISQLYTGSISDKEITERSGFLDLPFDANDSVMADKGFTIQDLLPVGVSLNIPPFLGSSSQMSAEDVVKTQSIASLRIHVERSINKIKNFHIWDGILSLSLTGIVNQMWTVCAHLCNVQEPIIS